MLLEFSILYYQLNLSDFKTLLRILKMTYFICHFWWDWLRFRLDSFQFCRTVSMWDLRYLKETCLYWEWGVDSVKRDMTRSLLFFLWLQTICCQQLQHFNWWYLYIYSQYLCYANVSMISSDLVTFSTVFMFVIISLMNYANTSCNCRLMLVLICWYMSCYKFGVVINKYMWFTSLLCDLV